MPHKHASTLATFHTSRPELAEQAIDAALAAKPEWESMPFSDRAAIFLKVRTSNWRRVDVGRGADPNRVIGCGPYQWKVPRQDLCCHHARPGKERMAGRDRCCRRAHRLLPLRRPASPGALLPAAVRELPWSLEVRPSHLSFLLLRLSELTRSQLVSQPRRVPRPRGLRLRRHPVQLHCHRRKPRRRTRSRRKRPSLEALPWSRVRVLDRLPDPPRGRTPQERHPVPSHSQRRGHHQAHCQGSSCPVTLGPPGWH